MRKKQAVLRSLGIGFFICALLLFGACGNPAGDEGRVSVTGVAITPEDPQISPGEIVQLTAVVTPENATDKTIVWKSSDPSIANVSNTGLVSAYAVGSASITATSADGPEDTTTVGVVSSLVENITLTGPGGSITSDTVINIAVGEDPVAINASVSPAGVNQTVNLVSGNPAVAAVINGTISAVGAGNTTITVRSAIDPTKTITFTVHVEASSIPLTGITLNQTALNLTLGGADAALAVVYAPLNTTQTGVSWSSSNPAVATVNNNGVVHAVGGGTAIITAASTVNNAITASCDVDVRASFNGAELRIEFEGLADETITLDTAVDQWDQLVISAPAGFDRYLWYMGSDFMGETSNPETTYPLYYVAPGRHYITVIVDEGGYHFSKTLIYTVGY
jgi:uncharacterized protein YjdB